MAATSTLRSEIQAVLRPYMTGSDEDVEPPFSLAELMVMAGICSTNQNGRASEMQIMQFLQRFPYYNARVLQEEYPVRNHAYYALYRRNKKISLVSQLHAIGSYDVPMLSQEVEDEDYSAHFFVSQRDARSFLRNILAPRTGVFRFLDLPPEVRLIVYEMLLRFPASGLGFDSRRKGILSGGQMYALEKEKLEGPVAPVKWMADSYRDYRNRVPIATMPEVLAILLTNKQIHNEALPVFYSINHFHTSGVNELTHMLRRCGPERRRFFTSLSLDYPADAGLAGADAIGRRACKLIDEAKGLHRLVLKLDDVKVLIAANRDGKSKEIFQNVEDAPMIAALGLLRVRELELLGNCPRIKAYLTPKLLITDEDKEEIDNKKKFYKRELAKRTKPQVTSKKSTS